MDSIPVKYRVLVEDKPEWYRGLMLEWVLVQDEMDTYFRALILDRSTKKFEVVDIEPGGLVYDSEDNFQFVLDTLDRTLDSYKKFYNEVQEKIIKPLAMMGPYLSGVCFFCCSIQGDPHSDSCIYRWAKEEFLYDLQEIL